MAVNRPKRRVRALPIAFGIAACLAAADARAEGGGPPFDFVEGEYSVVGREPDGGASYSGSASIELGEGGLVLKRRRVDGKEIAATGSVEVPSPPGEGKVLRFRWQEGGPTTMTCLVSGDLDNYARLTCLWFREGSQPIQPGLEAMFPMAGWDR